MPVIIVHLIRSLQSRRRCSVQLPLEWHYGRKVEKWWFSKGIPLISGKSRLMEYYNLPRLNTNILGGSNLMQMDGNFEGFPSYTPWKFNSSPLKSYLPTQ